jgi:hypothetical protein
MTTIVHTLGKRNWKGLHEIYENGYLHGGCYEFAIALHQGLGWPLVGLFIQKYEAEWKIEHAGVRTPDGKVFDIRGPISEKTFGEPYTCPPYDVREITIADLTAPAPVSEHAIQKARCLGEMLWPGLPWRNSYLSELVAIVDELEAFSRKHNKWIRTPPGTISPPQLQEGDGSEGGYDLRPMINGSGYTINCRIGK